jgi:hypothetical protein
MGSSVSCSRRPDQEDVYTTGPSPRASESAQDPPAPLSRGAATTLHYHASVAPSAPPLGGHSEAGHQAGIHWGLQQQQQWQQQQRQLGQQGSTGDGGEWEQWRPTATAAPDTAEARRTEARAHAHRLAARVEEDDFELQTALALSASSASNHATAHLTAELALQQHRNAQLR